MPCKEQGMELRDEPVSKLENRQSFRFPSTAEAAEAISHGVDALNLLEKPRRWLQAAGNANIEAGGVVQYPLRPSEPDCTYYLKTGRCKFGCYCRFNHPREKRLLQIINIKERDKGSQKLVDQCKFYLMPGGCRFGEECRYSHNHEKADSVPVELNVIGLPVRSGERECPYYIRTGICKYSTSCKFHHPEPSGFAGPQVVGYQGGISFQNKIGNLHLLETSQALKKASNDCIPLLDTSKPYMPTMSFSQWLNLHTDQSRCMDSSSFSLTKTTSRHPLADSENAISKPVDAAVQKVATDENSKEISKSEPHNCMGIEGFKLELASMNNHSKNHPSQSETCHFSAIGLPLRPDQTVCIYYDRFGICKYGPACKFDHPVDDNMEQSSQVSSTMISCVEEVKMEANSVLLSPSS